MKAVGNRKVCSQCGKTKSLSQFAMATRLADGLRCSCKLCDSVSRTSKHSRDVRSEYFRQYRRKARKELIDAYGGECVCCNESDLPFLTLDHEKNDGNLHRRRFHNNTIRFHAWLKSEGFPKDLGLRVMCWNCNCARQFNDGICPHKNPVLSLVEAST